MRCQYVTPAVGIPVCTTAQTFGIAFMNSHLPSAPPVAVDSYVQS